MNAREAIKEIEETVRDNRNAVSRVLAAKMVADAINKLAVAQERQTDIQEKQFEITAGMMHKITPMIDKSVEMMEREDEGEEWKRSLGDNDNED